MEKQVEKVSQIVYSMKLKFIYFLQILKYIF